MPLLYSFVARGTVVLGEATQVRFATHCSEDALLAEANLWSACSNAFSFGLDLGRNCHQLVASSWSLKNEFDVHLLSMHPENHVASLPSTQQVFKLIALSSQDGETYVLCRATMRAISNQWRCSFWSAAPQTPTSLCTRARTSPSTSWSTRASPSLWSQTNREPHRIWFPYSSHQWIRATCLAVCKGMKRACLSTTGRSVLVRGCTHVCTGLLEWSRLPASCASSCSNGRRITC